MTRFFNTLTRKEEEFQPIEEGKVKLYTCGPTVHDFAHIGNLRCYLWEDILRRYLEYRGYDVQHVMNITDVEDKTIIKSQEHNDSLSAYTERYTEEFYQDLKSLNVLPANYYPKATGYIEEMIKIIEGLIASGHAYKADDGSVYYSVSKFEDYGKLAGIKLENLQAGKSGRVASDEYDKENAGDFALWKAWEEEDGDVHWDSPWGKGRPGWHIECSAMSMSLLGESIDIHCGAVDNIFPHHQNEIAQSEAFTGKKFVRYWLHCAHLKVEGKKMSKSLGNFYTLRDLSEKGFHPVAFRYMCASTHYRSEVNFSLDGLEAATKTLLNLGNLVARINAFESEERNSEADEAALKLIGQFEELLVIEMDNDLNTPLVFSGIHEFINDLVKLTQKSGSLSGAVMNQLNEALNGFESITGIPIPISPELTKTEKEEVKSLIASRAQYREDKNWEEADKAKTALSEKNIEVVDTARGSLWFHRVEIK